MLRNIKMYLRFSGQNIHALMEYKNDFLVSTIAGAVWQTVGLVFLFALFSSIRLNLLRGCALVRSARLTRIRVSENIG